MNTNTWIGYLLAVGFVLVSAGRDATIRAQHRPLATYFLLLVAFLPAAALAAGAVTAIPTLRPRARQWREGFAVFFSLNITTLLNWLTYFESLKRINATLCAAVIVGGLPLSILLLRHFFDRRALNRTDAAAAALVAVGVAFLAGHDVARGASHLMPTAVGILLAAFSSLFAASNNWLVGQLRPLKFSALSIFAGRFWLLILAASLVAACDGFGGFSGEMDDWFFAGSIGFFGVAFPVLLLQGAIVNLGALPPTFMTSFHPACVWILLSGTWLLAGTGNEPHLAGFLGVVVVACGMMIGIRSAHTQPEADVQREADGVPPESPPRPSSVL